MGNKFVVGNHRRCIGCGTCMAACMMEHDPVDGVPIPRLTLTKTYGVSIPVGCHHCQDAPCAASCPQNVLYVDEGRVFAKSSGCIGCSSCVMACPYGAIDVVSVTSTTAANGLVYKLSPKSMPIKCDLCATREEGPACVQACLTKGLTYMDEDSLAGLVSDRQYAAAVSAGY